MNSASPRDSECVSGFRLKLTCISAEDSAPHHSQIVTATLKERWLQANSPSTPNRTGTSPHILILCWGKSSKLRLHWTLLLKCVPSHGQSWSVLRSIYSLISIKLFEKTQGGLSYAFITQFLLISGEVIKPTLLLVLTHNSTFSAGHLTSYHLSFLTRSHFFLFQIPVEIHND